MKTLRNRFLLIFNLINFTSSKLIFVSIDGFRYDYIQKYSEYLPTLCKLQENSAFLANGVKNVFPTNTFPNHWSMATGLYPEDHGIVANNFYDRQLKKTFSMISEDVEFWKGSEPIWETAEKQNITSVVVHFPGHNIKGFEPTYVHESDIYKAALYSVTYLVDTVFHALNNETNPAQFAMLYIGEPDSSAHKFGADDEFVFQQFLNVDSGIRYLLEKLSASDNLIITGDHGMVTVEKSLNFTKPEQFFDQKLVEKAIFDGPLLLVYAKQGKKMLLKAQLADMKRKHPNIDWYTQDTIPQRWHFKGNKNRSPDILGITAYKSMWFSEEKNRKGMHGWDNKLPDMRPVFIGHGPGFRKNLEHNGTVEIVDMYPLIAHLIGLNYSNIRNVSGKLENVMPLLTDGQSILRIWFEQYIMQYPSYVLVAAGVLAVVTLLSCCYCCRIVFRTIGNRKSQNSVYKGGYFLSDMESASEMDDDDDELNDFPRSSKKKSSGGRMRKFSIGFGHPSSRDA
ncbi:bis(5'-adenosyl)-triphosphatase enpp4-like [Symsagittifera roscoffensis]|uniref:bis(5'-adenosyl)-triphosphatase enpp4-like n=1 Tax=Symsagittifera roscoffensis TaxID=84072 RepID=UPI00307BC063